MCLSNLKTWFISYLNIAIRRFTKSTLVSNRYTAANKGTRALGSGQRSTPPLARHTDSSDIQFAGVSPRSKTNQISASTNQSTESTDGDGCI